MTRRSPKVAGREISFTVPLVPPSVNHYRVRLARKDQFGRAASYETAEAKAFKKAVAIFGRGHSPITSECEVQLVIYLGKGMRGDLDNYFKVTLDSLVAANIIRSDADIESLSGTKRRDWANPRTEITVKAVEV